MSRAVRPTPYHPWHDRPTRAAGSLEVPLRCFLAGEVETAGDGPELPGDAPGTVDEILGALVHTASGTALLALEACPSPGSVEDPDGPLAPVQAAPGMVAHRVGTELRLRIAPLEAGAMDAIYYVDLQPLLAQLAERFLATRRPAVALMG